MVSGVGTFNSRCAGNTNAVSRLGIPSLCFNDGPAGIRQTHNVTGFPTGINAASTFSKRLMTARGVALGEEFRGKGIHVYLGPSLDISRNPKAGRNWEAFGPDPYLTGEAAYATIIGVQSVGVQACAKHFLANNQEHWRYGLSADIDDRTTRELYLYGYYRAVEADVSTVMCDYIVIGGGVYKGLKAAVNSGAVSVARLNEMVARVLAPYYRLRQDDGTFPATNFDIQHMDGTGSLNLNVNVRTDEHTRLAREIAAKSAVLLKNAVTNGGTGNSSGAKGLPIKNGFKGSMAVIGQDAKMPKNGCYLNECNEGVMVVGWGSGSYFLDWVVPPIDSLTAQMTNAGGSITSSLSNDINAGVAAARGKDVAVVFVNAMSGELGFYDVVVGNMGDRNDLDLWWKGGSLVEAVAAVNSNTIVVVHSVGPVSMSWSSHPNVTAIIYAGAPGEQAGPSLVDVMWGAVNPSGRLPFSIADVRLRYDLFFGRWVDLNNVGGELVSRCNCV
ncbi:hypothetical protein FRB91_006909 [Serendipita sp. 411]|nr:hypothetical protein FRB91_006909 [Serendipita sp. 411]